MKKTVSIEGMSCQHCVHAVQTALRGVEGLNVEHVEIGSATFSYEPDIVELQSAIKAIEEEGYKVVGDELGV